MGETHRKEVINSHDKELGDHGRCEDTEIATPASESYDDFAQNGLLYNRIEYLIASPQYPDPVPTFWLRIIAIIKDGLIPMRSYASSRVVETREAWCENPHKQLS